MAEEREICCTYFFNIFCEGNGRFPEIFLHLVKTKVFCTLRILKLATGFSFVLPHIGSNFPSTYIIQAALMLRYNKRSVG